MTSYLIATLLKKRNLSIITLVALSSVSVASEGSYSLLTPADYNLAVTDQPAITRDDGLATYLEWRCFPAEVVSPVCVKNCRFDGNGKEECDREDDPRSGFPSLSVYTSEGYLDFDFDRDDGQCAQQVEKLRQLIQGQKHVCVLAAYLQEIDDSRSLWIMDRVKTDGGMWTGDPDDSDTQEETLGEGAGS